MAITTKEEFVKYCLRSLGAPVVNIDVTDEQIDDRYSEALKKMRDFHSSGSERIYLKHQLTQDNVDNQYIDLNPEIDGIIRVFPLSSATASGDYIFNIDYQMRLNDIWDMNSSGLAYYVQIKQYTALMDMILTGSRTILFRYTRSTNRVHIDVRKSKLVVGNWVLLEASLPVNPEVNTDLFDEPWFKEYMTALIKRQWGANLKKFTGVQMVGGASINGQAIYEEALQQIAELEEELRLVWEEPVAAFFMG